MSQTLDTTVAAFYGAAAEPVEWNDALARLAELTDSQVVHLQRWHPGLGRPTLSVTAGALADAWMGQSYAPQVG